MNCEQYRQAITEDPSFDDSGAHVSFCASCQAFRAGIEALDRRIGRALAIDIPEFVMPELPDIETEEVVTLPLRRRVKAPAWYAIAATVFLAAMIGIRMIGSDIVYESLADEVIAHLDHEPYALRVTDKPVSDRRLRSVVPASVAEFDDSASLITYAQNCVINGQHIPHLVIQGANGPVTVLLLPDEKLFEAVPLTGQNINGVILPVGDGSVAIIGPREERLDTIKEQVVSSLTWGI
jgi:hypothetical protein